MHKKKLKLHWPHILISTSSKIILTLKCHNLLIYFNTYLTLILKQYFQASLFVDLIEVFITIANHISACFFISQFNLSNNIQNYQFYIIRHKLGYSCCTISL